jgi:S1-C subfamily serine protease
VGLGLAVPINETTRTIIGTLISEGVFRRAYIGVAGGSRPLPPRLARETGRSAAVEVVEVVEGSPAARAGLRPADLILDVDGAPTVDAGDLQRLMTRERIGSPVRLRIARDERTRDVEVIPAELEL